MKLVYPRLEHKEKAIDFIKEFREYDSEINGSGALEYYLDEFSYEEWLEKVQNDIDLANIAPGRVPAITYFYMREEDERIVGMINMRLTLNDFQRELGGHAGYCVRPTERQKHYATGMLTEALKIYKMFDVDTVLVSCDRDNQASRGTILNCGGKLLREFYSDVFKTNVQMYGIEL